MQEYERAVIFRLGRLVKGGAKVVEHLKLAEVLKVNNCYRDLVFSL